MKTILTFDVGTTSMKCCAFDEAMHLVASATTEYALSTQGQHIVEADPQLYWQGMCKSIGDLFLQGIDPASVVACGITTQGETTILLDKDGTPLCPAIVWLDDRASKEADELAAAIPQDLFYRTTGLPEISGALPLAKLKMRMEDPALQGRIHKVLLLEDYLVYQLTGQLKTEPSLLCSTGYYDIMNHCYCKDFLALAGATEDLLPEICPCGSIAGTVTAEASQQCGLPAGVAVVLTAMDQTASAIGAGNIAPGVVSETTGTCLTVVATTEKPDFSTQVSLQYYTHYDGRYLALAYNATAAIVMKWFKDHFIGVTDSCRNSNMNPYQYMSTLAATIPAGAEGLYLLPHFAGKVMPNPCPDVRGCFYGISLNTTPSHFIRAIMEGVSYMLRENIESFNQAGIPVSQIRSLGGGSRDTVWNSVKASITGKDLYTTYVEESTSLGAAILCAVAVGLAPSVPQLVEQTVRLKDHYGPNPADQITYDTLYRRYLKLDKLMAEFSTKAQDL